MRGEWKGLSVMPGRDLIILDKKQIYVPAAAREGLVKVLHDSTHRKNNTLHATLRRYYTWPGMRKKIQELTSPCKICLPFEPAKEWAKPCGLPISLDKLASMDLIVCDGFSIQGAQLGPENPRPEIRNSK